ncbi:MAG: sigma-70 family RNA polymerase sigma factor [Candidatus Polarisedimenticolia bacterium]
MKPGATGARGTFEQLAREHMSALYNMALRLTRNPSEAEDLVQDTLLRAYRFFNRYEQGTNFKAWVFKILKNSFINRYRKDQQIPETVDFSAIEEGLERLVDESYREGTPPDPEQAFLSGVVDHEIEEALASLPEEYRMVFLMAVQQEMSYKEIAAALSIPIGTVMSRLHRARRLMQARLTEYGRRRRLTGPEAAAPVDINRYRRRGDSQS